MKAGPSGPALNQALNDLLNLSPEMVKSICKFGGGIIERDINIILKQPRPILEDLANNLGPRRNLLRKLSVLGDKEGKLRIFAILDY